jgi:hypothetical protein
LSIHQPEQRLHQLVQERLEQLAGHACYEHWQRFDILRRNDDFQWEYKFIPWRDYDAFWWNDGSHGWYYCFFGRYDDEYGRHDHAHWQHEQFIEWFNYC